MSQQINLFNPVFMYQRKYFSMFAMTQMLGLIVLGSALVYGYAVYHVKTLKVQFDETGKRYVIEQGKLQRYTDELTAQQSGQLLENELKSTEARLSAQNEIIETLKSGVIGNSTGYSEYMRAFAHQAVNGLWLSSFSINDDATQIILRGSVLSPELLPAYIRKLNQEPAMRGKQFASLLMQQSGNEVRYVDFTLQSTESGKAEKK
jgi:hypothetical protein